MVRDFVVKLYGSINKNLLDLILHFYNIICSSMPWTYTIFFIPSKCCAVPYPLFFSKL